MTAKKITRTRKAKKTRPYKVSPDLIKQIEYFLDKCDGVWLIGGTKAERRDYYPAIIGYTDTNGIMRCIYRYDKLADVYIKRDNMSRDEAEKWIDQNILGAYMPDGPIIMLTRGIR